jgi:hypothetical protein
MAEFEVVPHPEETIANRRAYDPRNPGGIPGVLQPPPLNFPLTSGGPDRWPGQSGKELGSTARFLHALVEQHATEVSRVGSGVLYNTDH